MSKSNYSITCLFSFLTLFFVIADQFIKRIVTFNLELYGSITVIDGFFSIYYTRNTGSAFSMFADKSWGIYFLTVVSLVLGVILLYLMICATKVRMVLMSTALCFLASGAFGNLIDRFTLKYVIDYLRFDFGSYTFPIFNLADILAVCGTAMFMAIIIFGKDYSDRFFGYVFPSRKKVDEIEVPEDLYESEQTGGEDNVRD